MIRFDNLPPEVVQAMCTPMHLVLPATTQPSGAPSGALYIGSLAAVQDPAALRAAHITHLVQVIDAPWLPLSEKDGFSCLRVPIMDERTVDIRPYLEGVCAHIDNALRAGRSVLVHCQQVRAVCLLDVLTIKLFLRASPARPPSSWPTSSATTACPTTRLFPSCAASVPAQSPTRASSTPCRSGRPAAGAQTSRAVSRHEQRVHSSHTRGRGTCVFIY